MANWRCLIGLHRWSEWHHDSQYRATFDAQRRYCRRLCGKRQKSNPIFPGAYPPHSTR